MAATLRRCESLPATLPPAPRAPRAVPPRSALAASKTVQKLDEASDRERVVSTWKTLQIEIGNLKNGLKMRDESSPAPNDGEDGFAKNSNGSTSADDREKRGGVRHANNGVAAAPAAVEPRQRHISFGAERMSSRTRAARRRTLLQRLLSWRTRDCDCRCPPQPPPPPRPEDLVCTCPPPLPPRTAPLAERGRSKSVGYEPTQEVQPFRRCASAGACVAGATTEGSGAAALRARAALTLARRYYPEGGWGWTVSVVSTLVQVLAHGLQLGGGTGPIACTAAHRFRVPALYAHG